MRLGFKVREKPVVFVHNLVLLEEGLEILKLFVVFDVKPKGKSSVNLINAYFSHHVKMVSNMAMLQKIIVDGGTRESVTHLVGV